MRKLLFRNGALVFLILALFIAVIGCGTKNNDSAEGSQPSPSAGGENGEASKLSGKLEIQYFVGGYGDTWWKDVIAEFQKKYPDLEVVGLGGPKINEQTKPRWIQGNPPDVVYIDGDGTFTESLLVQNQQLMDLTEWIKTAKNEDGELITDQLIGQPKTYDGVSYSIPLVFGVHGTWYDKAFFEQNGWETPKDWAGFLDVSQKALDKGITPYIHQGQYPYYFIRGFMRQGFVTANGGDASIIDDINGLKEGVFKSAPVMSTLDKVTEMNQKGYLSKKAMALNHTDSQNQWLQHKAIFIPSGLWLENEMKKFAPEGFDYGFIPSVTQDAGGKFVAVPYTNEIGIAKQAKNPEAAKAFLQFVFTKQNAVHWAETTGALMNYKADLESTNASGAVKSAMTYLNSDNTIVTSNDSSFDLNVEKAMEDATVALLLGDINKDQWADRMETAAAKYRK
ncbi:extracellular solute-binding protein [Paenibacillus solisilvae]|uniref:Extracellular solute-binding protein n=1 Tax=Paenibacillus solisilvae TaxID=2486751 RepID=A0ABW0W6C6_9BACL